MRNTQKQRPISDWRGRARDAAIGVLIGLSVGASAVANPQGPQVVHGQANFARPDGSTLNITNSPNAIINWQSFGVGTHETTRFIQQSSSSAVLNRVTGGTASQILGQLQSNGRVFLINPQGIVFGPNATVDTAGLIASTLDIANEDFLAGRLSFSGSSDSGALDNQGFIKAGPDGSVFLIAPNIRNSGIVQTDGGRLVLVAGEQVRLVSLDSAELSYVVQAPEHEVVNLGALLTGGGAASVFAGTLRQHGEVNANAVVRDAAGNIQLVARRDVELGEGSKTSANGPNAGTILVDAREGAAVVSGEVEAVGAEGTGGKIDVFGETVVVNPDGLVDASGASGGGNIRLGGSFQGRDAAVHHAQATQLEAGALVRADALERGTGGEVIVWSEQVTLVDGYVFARGIGEGAGGFVETSSRGFFNVSTVPDTGGGTWLIDPEDILICNPGASSDPTNCTGSVDVDIANVGSPPNSSFLPDADNAIPSILSVTTIAQALQSGNVSISTDGGNGDNVTQPGNITLADDLDVVIPSESTHTLSLFADNEVNIRANISNTGVGVLNVNIDSNSSGGSGQIRLGQDGRNVAFNLPGGTLNMTSAAVDGQGDPVGALTVSVFSGLNSTDQVIVDAAAFNVAADNPGDVQVSSGTLDLRRTVTNIPVLELIAGQVLVDGENAGSGSLTVNQLIAGGGSITGSDADIQTPPDDTLTIGSSGLDMQQSLVLSGLTVNSEGPTTTDGGSNDKLNLTAGTVFTNTGTFDLQGSGDEVISTDNTGTFVNEGTLTTGVTSRIGSVNQGDLKFENNGGTISVASGGELQFRDGGTFTGVTTLDTSGGAGTINLSTGTFTVTELASFQGEPGDRVVSFGDLFRNDDVLKIEGDLTLDTLTNAGGDVELDSNNDGSSTLTVGQLRVISGSGNSIVGSDTATPDDVLEIVSGFDLQRTFTLSGLTVDSSGTTTTNADLGNIYLLLNGGTTFTNSGTFELQASGDTVYSNDSSNSTFINTGTLAKTGSNESFVGSNVGNFTFRNEGGTISVASGGELKFRQGGTFTGDTTLDTSDGAGKINFDAGTFTVTELASFQGDPGDRVLFMEGFFGLLEIEGNLELDVLTLANGDVELDSNNDGSSTLTVGQLRVVTNSNSSITGMNAGTTPDDVLNIGSSGFDLQRSITLSGLQVNSFGTTTTDAVIGNVVLSLNGGTTFTNHGTFELQASGDTVWSTDSSSSTFINTATGTLAKTGANVSYVGNAQSGQNFTFQNEGGTISVASGGELAFRDNSTFTADTTLDTSGGAGTINFHTGTFTVQEGVFFQGDPGDLVVTLGAPFTADAILNIEGDLMLDVLTIADNSEVQLDSNNNGVSTLTVDQLRVTQPSNAIVGSDTATPDDVLEIVSGFDLQQTFTLSGLQVNSSGTTTTNAAVPDVRLYLDGGTVFTNTNTGTFELQANRDKVFSNNSNVGTFINRGTLAKTGNNVSDIGLGGTGNFTFLNEGGTISVASGGELEFEQGGTFTGVTTLDTSGGTGKIDLNTGTFTVDGAASFAGVTTGDRALSMENPNGLLLIENNLTLDTLTLAGGAVVLDQPGEGVATLTIDELRVTNSGSSITGANASSPDDILNLNTTFEQQSDFTLRGLIVNSAATVTSGSVCCVDLYLSGNTVFNNAGIFQFQGSSGGLSSASPDEGDTDAGVFINTGTLAKIDASATRIGETAGNLDFQNNGGTISVVSGGELEFREGGTFTGVTTLDTAGGAGTIDFRFGTFTVEEAASIVGVNPSDRTLFLGTGGEGANSTLKIEGDLALDALGLFVDATVIVDSNFDGASTLSVGQINTSGSSNNISGGADDLLVVGAGGLQMSSTFTLAGLNATSPLTSISPGTLQRFELVGGAVFTNTGTFDFGGEGQAIRGDQETTGTFINSGTLRHNTGTGTSTIGESGTLTFQSAPGASLVVGEGSELQFLNGGTFSSSTNLVTNGQQGAINLLEGTFVVTDTGPSSSPMGDSNIALGLNAVLNLDGTVVFDSIEMNGGDIVIDSDNSGSETLTVDTLIFNSNAASSQFSGLSSVPGVPDDTLAVTSVVPSNTPIQAINLNLSGGGFTGPLDLTGGAAFTNTGIFDAQSPDVFSTDGTGRFRNLATGSLVLDAASGTTTLGGVSTPLVFENVGGAIRVLDGSGVPGGNAVLRFGNGGTFEGSGQSFETGGRQNAIELADGAYTIKAGSTFTGTDRHFQMVSASLATESAVQIDTLALQGPSSLFVGAGTLSVSGLDVGGNTIGGGAETQARLQLRSGGTTNVTAPTAIPIAYDNDGTTVVTADLSLSGGGNHTGAFQVASGAQLDLLDNHSLSGANAGLDGLGTVNIGNGAALVVSVPGVLSVSPTLTNSGLFGVSGGQVLFNANSSHSAGSAIGVQAGTEVRFDAGNHAFDNSQFIGGGTGSVFWSGGQISGTTLTNEANLVWQSGSVSLTEFTNASTGTFFPQTSANFQANVTNNGVISPGTSPGLFNIVGNFTQGPSGTLLLELASPGTVGVDYDALSSTGTMSLDGNLQLVFLNGYTPTAGDLFALLNSAGTTGNFASIQFPPNSDGTLIIGAGGVVSLDIFDTTAPTTVATTAAPTTAAPTTVDTQFDVTSEVVIGNITTDDSLSTSPVSSDTAVSDDANAPAEQNTGDSSQEASEEDEETPVEERDEGSSEQSSTTDGALECTP